MNKNKKIKKQEKNEAQNLKPQKFLSDFKDFIFKGNFGDVITGMVIATALTTLVRSLITDVATPFVRYFLGDVDVTSWKIPLNPEVSSTEIIYVDLGVFLQNVINFLVLALMFFILAKIWSKAFKKKEEAEEKQLSDKLLILKSIDERLERLEILNNATPTKNTDTLVSLEQERIKNANIT